MAREFALSGRHVRRRNRVCRSIDDDPEVLTAKTFPHDQGHIVRCRHVFGIRHAAGICKMCTRAPDLGCPVIHHLDKVVDGTSSDIFSKLRRHIVS